MIPFNIISSAGAGGDITQPALPTEGGGTMWDTITSGVGSFVSGVLTPVANFCTQSEVPLAFLSVTFVCLGVRVLRRTIGAFGRGR